MAESGQNHASLISFRLGDEIRTQGALGNILHSPLGLSFEGENGQVLVTMPFENVSQGITAQNMSLMGFPSRNAFSDSPQGGEGEVSFENARGFCKTGPSVLEISSANVSASPPKP